MSSLNTVVNESLQIVARYKFRAIVTEIEKKIIEESFKYNRYNRDNTNPLP
jgi:hypothetical protein